MLINEEEEKNPWKISFQQGFFNISSDSHLFKTQEYLENAGLELKGNHFYGREEHYVPLYEPKMFWQYDHRFGSYKGLDLSSNFQQLPRPNKTQYQDPSYVPLPRYWVHEDNFSDRFDNENSWLMVFRDVVRNMKRYAVFSVIPFTAVGNTAPIVMSDVKRISLKLALLANFNSMVLDFIVRQKVGGAHLNYYILKQVPIFEPEDYTEEELDFILPKILKLTYSARDLKAFVRDVLNEVGKSRWNRWFSNYEISEDSTPEPFKWKPTDRFKLRCKLDAFFAHKYKVPQENLEIILDSFKVIRKQEKEQYSVYRTKKRILNEYKKLS